MMWTVSITISNPGLRMAEKRISIILTALRRAGYGAAQEALKLGLVDEIGGIQDAVDCAARLAKTNDYRLREFPEPKNFLELLLNNYNETIKAKSIREDLGTEGLKWYKIHGLPEIH